eukprot:11697672-Alexandrium_andersonii.AAC.1
MARRAASSPIQTPPPSSATGLPLCSTKPPFVSTHGRGFPRVGLLPLPQPSSAPPAVGHRRGGGR